MFSRNTSSSPIIMIRDVTFQNLSGEDKLILSAPAQLTAVGTLVVPEDNSAREVASMLREMQANRVIVLEKGTRSTLGVLAPNWASEQIRINLNLLGDFHDQIAQWEELQHERVQHEWLQRFGQPPLYYCNCHNCSEVSRHTPLSCYV